MNFNYACIHDFVYYILYMNINIYIYYVNINIYIFFPPKYWEVLC